MDPRYAAESFKNYATAPKSSDFRVVFDTAGKDIDGVTIGTPDHANAVIAMEAMRRGKHV